MKILKRSRFKDDSKSYGCEMELDLLDEIPLYIRWLDYPLFQSYHYPIFALI